MRASLRRRIERYQQKIVRQIIHSNKSVIVTGKNSIGKTFIAKKLFEIFDDRVYLSGYPKEIRDLKNEKTIDILRHINLNTYFCISDENYLVNFQSKSNKHGVSPIIC
jgi:sigma54-dependent transcription regulator